MKSIQIITMKWSQNMIVNLKNYKNDFDKKKNNKKSTNVL